MSAGSAMPPPGPGASGTSSRGPSAPGSRRSRSRTWWDDEAPGYQAEHGAFLGDVDFVWCPDALREADAALLGPPEALVGARVLEVGCGAASCARWLVERGADAVGLDLSAGMLPEARAADARSGVAVPLVQADASHLPFPDAAFDLACSAFGAVPFVADTAALMAEVARVLRPGGRWVFAVNHPMRWIFPDHPGEDGLCVTQSYFDRTPYAEADDDGRIVYVEHHRTVGDRVADIVGAGLVLEGVVEPEWPEDLDEVWGQWSPLRGALRDGDLLLPPARRSRRRAGRAGRARVRYRTPRGRRDGGGPRAALPDSPVQVLADLLEVQRRRFAALDPRLPRAAAPPPGDVVVVGAPPDRVAGVVTHHVWPAGSGSLLWSAARVTELHPVIGAAGHAPLHALVTPGAGRCCPPSCATRTPRPSSPGPAATSSPPGSSSTTG